MTSADSRINLRIEGGRYSEGGREASGNKRESREERESDGKNSTRRQRGTSGILLFSRLLSRAGVVFLPRVRERARVSLCRTLCGSPTEMRGQWSAVISLYNRFACIPYNGDTYVRSHSRRAALGFLLSHPTTAANGSQSQYCNPILNRETGFLLKSFFSSSLLFRDRQRIFAVRFFSSVSFILCLSSLIVSRIRSKTKKNFTCNTLCMGTEILYPLTGY